MGFEVSPFHFTFRGRMSLQVVLKDGKPVLYCGVLFDHGNEMRQVFATGVNIISDSSLDEQKAEDVKIKLKALAVAHDLASRDFLKDPRLITLNLYFRTEF